jgi:hypothetical protein
MLFLNMVCLTVASPIVIIMAPGLKKIKQGSPGSSPSAGVSAGDVLSFVKVAFTSRRTINA